MRLLKDSKLIKLLKTFSASEMSEFEKFVDSPYFGHGRNLSDFFKCIKQYFPDFDQAEFTARNIFLKLHPGKDSALRSSENIIHKLSSELFKLGKEFLIQIEIENDENRRYCYLLNQLRVRKLYTEFEKEYKNSELTDTGNVMGSEDYFLDRYFLKRSYLEYCIDITDIAGAYEHILLLGELAAAATLIKGFRNIDTNHSSERYNIKVRYNLVDNLIGHLDCERLLDEMRSNNDKIYPYAAVSYGIHKIHRHPDQIRFYYELKELIAGNLALFGHVEKYILYQTLLGYCIRKQEDKFSESFLREEFEIIRTIHELGIYKYSESDKIQINNFRSTVLCAIDNDEIDWLEDYVLKYINELHDEHIVNMRYYSAAFINFERGQFEKALDCINSVKYDYFMFKLDVRNLMFKIYYELEYIEQAYSMLETIKRFLSNSKDLSDVLILRERNFVKFASELLKIRSSKLSYGYDFLRKKIQNEKVLECKKWLLQKAQLL